MALHFDMIIVGSGPAGSAAATVAAQGGLKVALLDKAGFPRDKLCGGAITGRAARFMADIFGQPVTGDMFLTARRFRMAWFGKPLGVIDNAPPIYLGLRRRFDSMLHTHAVTAGAQVFAPVRLDAVDPQAGTVTLADGRTNRTRSPLDWKSRHRAPTGPTAQSKSIWARPNGAMAGCFRRKER
ncbi:MAG: FAD-dependent oxidoreductase [Pararhodobacter sp.]|nr:FAD-dependent oxidoreductase [Pararhodobacter sp.]